MLSRRVQPKAARSGDRSAGIATTNTCTRPCLSPVGRAHTRLLSSPKDAAAAVAGSTAGNGSARAAPPAAAAAAAAAAASAPWQDSSRFHQGVHYTPMEVRDYELDQFHVVNNAVYASYVQHARHRALAVLGLSVDRFQEAGTLMALSELALKYKGPLRTGDTFYVTVAPAQVSAARIVICHTVVKLPGGKHQPVEEPQVVAEGDATVVFLDSSYKPIRIPAEVKGVFAQLSKEYHTSKEQAASRE